MEDLRVIKGCCDIRSCYTGKYVYFCLFDQIGVLKHRSRDGREWK
jgi:hypothetical protein